MTRFDPDQALWQQIHRMPVQMKWSEPHRRGIWINRIFGKPTIAINTFEECMRFLRQFGSTISTANIDARGFESSELSQIFIELNAQCSQKVHTIVLNHLDQIHIRPLHQFVELWYLELISCNLAHTFQKLGAYFQSTLALRIKGKIGDYDLQFRFPNMRFLYLELDEFSSEKQLSFSWFLLENKNSLHNVFIEKTSDGSSDSIDYGLLEIMCEFLPFASVEIKGFTSNAIHATQFFESTKRKLRGLVIEPEPGHEIVFGRRPIKHTRLDLKILFEEKKKSNHKRKK